jgi:gluconokinase
MPASLLDSQLETLEPPADALAVDVGPSPEAIVATIRHGLGL